MFEVVFVCTGNRNRSVVAEAALRRATEGLPVHVHSVGLLDLGPAPALPETLQLGEGLGLDLTAHRARRMGDVPLGEVDLVLGLEWEHVAAAVVDGGVPSERAFTLLELAELIEGLTVEHEGDVDERARALVRAADAKRKATKRRSMAPSIPDPFGGPRDGFSHMGQTVVHATTALAEGLFGVRAQRGA